MPVFWRFYPPASWRKHAAGALVVAIALLGVGFALTIYNAADANVSRRPPAVTVGLAKVATQDVPLTLDALGAVTPEASATVTARASGTIKAVLFKEGQMVAQGQPLVEIDPAPYQAALLQAQGQMARDQAMLEDARINLQRYQTLLAQDSIAKQQVDTQAATVRQFDGVVQADRAAVQTAQLNLGYTHVTAPIAGRAGLRLVDLGNNVTAGGTTGIVTIAQIDPIDVAFSIPQAQIAAVQAGRAANPALPVILLSADGAQTLAKGVLLTLDNAVDPSTGTVKAKARFANQNGTLIPNQFATVRMQIGVLKGALTVPATAVRQGPDGSFVWTVDKEETAHMQPVKTGPTQGEVTVITEGLVAGASVVTEGGDNLRDGASVVLPGKSAAGKGKREGAGKENGKRRKADGVSATP